NTRTAAAIQPREASRVIPHYFLRSVREHSVDDSLTYNPRLIGHIKRYDVKPLDLIARERNPLVDDRNSRRIPVRQRAPRRRAETRLFDLVGHRADCNSTLGARL